MEEKEVKKLISISSWLVALQIVSLVVFVVFARVLYVDVQGVKQDLRGNLAGTEPAQKNVANWRELIGSHNAIRGSETAPITVVEFTDFQCPYCREFSKNTREQLLSKYGEKIRYVFKHFPLEQIHAQAKQAAVAAQCAGREDRFWEMEKILFRSDLSAGSLIEGGKSLGLSSTFQTCVQEQLTIADVEQDIKDGLKIGVRGTPTFVVNGRMFSGAVPLGKWESLIEQ